MKRIIWIGDARQLPGHGLAVYGQHISLPEAQAASFVEQGLAEFEPLPKASKKTSQENES